MFKLQIELSNEEMRTRAHVAEALEKVAEALRHGGEFEPRETGPIRDWNGNHVGDWMADPS